MGRKPKLIDEMVTFFFFLIFPQGCLRMTIKISEVEGWNVKNRIVFSSFWVFPF